jgi:DNA-binding NarL/FixJ family response regulator
MSDQIKIILADDHPLVRQGLRQVIEHEKDLFIAAECGDGESALAEIEKQSPDVLILDVDMPRTSGFDVLRRLRERRVKIKVILLTVHDEIEFFNEALNLGAQAYILKDCAIEEVISAIRSVTAGQNYVSQRLNQYFFHRSNRSESNGLANLTPTERQILKLIADYKTSKEIGEALFISPLTVKTHRRNINAKLEIEGSNALMRFALENKNLL